MRNGSNMRWNIPERRILRGLPVIAALLLVLIGTASATACTNNWVGGACSGNINYTANTTLTSGVNDTAGNILVFTGVIITTNGYSIIDFGTFNNTNGTVTGGTWDGGVANGGSGSSNTNCFGGSGSGGGAGYSSCSPSGCLAAGGNGGSTNGTSGSSGVLCTTSGAGATPSAPVMSMTNLTTWLNNGISSYTCGAGGGAGGEGTTPQGQNC